MHFKYQKFNFPGSRYTVVTHANEDFGSVLTRNDLKFEIPSQVIIQTVCTNSHIQLQS